ncbi:BMP family protein [Ammoniphilus sp. YIM 78166]|uniref:BMP family lipoprotein n=1 Tax=Ammoniphilus sp. YIM 78166 TaxID=1644106 RepID=UPI001070529F|nr:BMP family ABC transporter substrate-binding protein [Ammoniphilus sp. YIM 78166]
MLKKGLSVFMATLLVTAGVLAGCGGGNQAQQPAPQQGTEAPQPDAAEKLKIGMVTDVGGVNDNSFNESAWEGLQKAQSDLGVEAQYAESKSDADYEPNLNRFARGGTNLTWGIGFLMEDAISNVSKSIPDANFGIIDSNLGGEIPPNVAAVTFKEHEGSFLMGVIAGKMTQSNKVGFVGGMKFALIEKFEYGFRAGVKAVNPDAQVIVNYVGAFDKPDQGKTFAATMYDSGVDIIFHASGATGDGVFAEAKERGNVWVIGVDKDQSFLAPERTLSSMVKRVDVAVFTVSEQLKNGQFPGGKETVLGLAEEGVAIAPTSDKNVPADVLDIVKEYEGKIKAGEIKVPQTEAEFNEFK